MNKVCKICKDVEAAYYSEVCTNCASKAYPIMAKYEYNFISHSGGMCPLVELQSFPSEVDAERIFNLGWRRNTLGEQAGKPRYFGPWGSF